MRNSRDTWRGLRSARCSVMGTPGAEGGSGRRTGRKTGTAPWPDPTRQGPAVPPGRRRQADRKESRTPWREQDAQEAKAGGRKAAGKRERLRRSSNRMPSYNRPDTGPGARLRKQADVRRVSLCRRSTGYAGTEGQVRRP